MNLNQGFEKQGNFLFRYRGQIPVLIFIVCLPVIVFSGNYAIDNVFEIITATGSVLISACGFLIRIITVGSAPEGTSGRNTQEQIAEQLNTEGIYSIVRHPLYLGNYLMWLGILCFTFNLPLLIILSMAYWFYYERIMFAEEAFLEQKFGLEFLLWSSHVPAIIPSFKNYKRSDRGFSIKKVLRQEYTGFLVIVFCYCFIDNLRYFILSGKINILRISVIILATAVIVTLTFRLLKYHSQVLK